jgi:hypothetical protein
VTIPDSSSLKLWEFVSEFGFVMVIVGVVGEGFELIVKWGDRRRGKATSKKDLEWLLPVETLFFVILTIGLAMEFLGSHNAMRISDAENGRLNLLSNGAYERSANAESNNLVLRSNVLVLQAQLQRRRITDEKKHIMIDMLIHAPKGRVTLTAVQSDVEAVYFLEDIEDVLKKSGFDVEQNLLASFWTSGTYPTGLALHIKNAQAPPPHADAILRAFKAAGINPDDTTEQKGMEDGLLKIEVFPKPIK